MSSNSKSCSIKFLFYNSKLREAFRIVSKCWFYIILKNLIFVILNFDVSIMPKCYHTTVKYLIFTFVLCFQPCKILKHTFKRWAQVVPRERHTPIDYTSCIATTIVIMKHVDLSENFYAASKTFSTATWAKIRYLNFKLTGECNALHAYRLVQYMMKKMKCIKL